MRTLFPTQIGYIPTGANQTLPSQINIGRDVATTSGTFGFGQAGRPDFIENFKIYLTKNTATDKTQNGTLTTYATVSIDVQDLITVVAGNAHAAAALNFTLREVDVCDGGTAKKMLILAGPTYLP